MGADFMTNYTRTIVSMVGNQLLQISKDIKPEPHYLMVKDFMIYIKKFFLSFWYHTRITISHGWRFREISQYNRNISWLQISWELHHNHSISWRQISWYITLACCSFFLFVYFFVVFLSFCHYVFFSFCLFFFFFFFFVFCLVPFFSFFFVFLSTCCYLFLSFFLYVFLSFCLLVFLSFCLFVFLSFCLCVFVSLCFSFFLYVCLFVFWKWI